MVDSVRNIAISSLINAQSANSAAARSPAQVITITQAPQKSAVVQVKGSGVTQTGKGAAPSGNLPRGSLVDRLV